MAELGREAAKRLAYEAEIFSELVILTQLAPFDIEPISRSLSKTGRLLVLEEGTQTLGWGAEILARLLEDPGKHPAAARRLGGLDLPIPASAPLETRVLPGVDAIMQTARKMV
jgi:pyruvate/2-oxoglutarate/acetoin dehydrogenase E1 component